MGYDMHIASYIVQARLDRPIAAHVNICPGGLQEGKDGAAKLVRSESGACQPILFFLSGWEHQARADARPGLLGSALRLLQKRSRRTEDCQEFCGEASPS